MIRRILVACGVAIVLAVAVVTAQGPAQPPAAQPTAALARANLAKPRPKAPFDLTGVWLHGGGAAGKSAGLARCAVHLRCRRR